MILASYKRRSRQPWASHEMRPTNAGRTLTMRHKKSESNYITLFPRDGGGLGGAYK
jgi:hypothetical protein